MNADLPERALKEAEGWLASAQAKLREVEDDEVLANVVCAQCIHAIIRANDALTLKFLGCKCTRHDDVAVLFLNLVRQKKIEACDEHFKELLIEAMKDKSGADYGKSSFSPEDAYYYIEEASAFVSAVKKYVLA